MKKIITLVTAMALSVSMFLFTGCDFSSLTNTKSEDATSIVTLSINPEVTFAVSDNKIMSVSSMNEDADILLSDVDLVGMDVDVASSLFVEMATDNGYIDEDSEDNEVTVEIITEDGEEDLENSIKDKINSYLRNKGISCKINSETFEEYKTEADALGITVQKLRLIYKAIEINPELVKEDLIAMDLSEIMQLISGNMNKFSFGTLKDDFFADRESTKSNI